MNLTLPTPDLGKLKQGSKRGAAHVTKGGSCFTRLLLSPLYFVGEGMPRDAGHCAARVPVPNPA